MVCSFVCLLFEWSFVCLSVGLFACWCVCLCVSLVVCLFVCVFDCLIVCSIVCCVLVCLVVLSCFVGLLFVVCLLALSFYWFIVLLFYCFVVP